MDEAELIDIFAKAAWDSSPFGECKSWDETTEEWRGIFRARQPSFLLALKAAGLKITERPMRAGNSYAQESFDRAPSWPGEKT